MGGHLESRVGSLAGLLIIVSSLPGVSIVRPIGSWSAHVVVCFLALVTLFVRSGLVFVRLALLLVQSLPALTKNLADLAYQDRRVIM